MNQELKKIMNAISKKTPNLIRDQQIQAKPKLVSFDSPQLNYFYGGAFTIGKINCLFGPYSSGKTSIANYIGGQLQEKVPQVTGRKDQNVVIFQDFERSFNIDFAEQNGLKVDPDHLIFMQPDSIEDFVDNVIPLIQTGNIQALILDSEAAAPTKTMMVDPSGKANFGQGAKAMAESLKKLNIICSNYDTSYIIISQERQNLTPMSHLPAVTGGYALPFYACTRSRVTKIDTIEENGETVGIKIRLRNYKNKTGIPFRTIERELRYKGGFISKEEYFNFFLQFGIIVQKGAFFKFMGCNKTIEGVNYKIDSLVDEKGVLKSFQGRTKMQEYLDQHPEDFEYLKKIIDQLLAHPSEELDSNNEDPNDEEFKQGLENYAKELAEEASSDSIEDEISEDEVK